jgi:hypothetical protein
MYIFDSSSWAKFGFVAKAVDIPFVMKRHLFYFAALSIDRALKIFPSRHSRYMMANMIVERNLRVARIAHSYVKIAEIHILCIRKLFFLQCASLYSTYITSRWDVAIYTQLMGNFL